MGENSSKLNFLKTGKLHVHLGSTLAITAILYYAVKHSVTFADLTAAIAGVPALFWVIAWIFDVAVDTGKVFSSMMRKYTSLGAGFGFLVFFLVFAGIGYELLVAAGAAASATTMLVAMLMSFIIVMPRTGTSIWLIYLYAAAVLVMFATGGHPDVSILPHSFAGGVAP